MDKDKLIDAINDRRVLSFTYQGEQCFAEPCAFGIGHDGAIMLTAFQTSGPTPLPDFPWIYRKIKDLINLEITHFLFEPRLHYSERDTRFRTIFASASVK